MSGTFRLRCIIGRALLMVCYAFFGLAMDPDVTQDSFSITADQLMDAKLKALKEKQLEQEKALAHAEHILLEEQHKEQRIFDNEAYLALSIINSAPPKEYRLKRTEIYVDGKLFARGGKRNHGLPRKSELFFGPVEPGCHEVLIKAQFIRLKNDFLNVFQGKREVDVSRKQTFIAKSGYRVEMEMEGLEVPNMFLELYRGPAFRFNKSVRPNFLSGAPLVSLDEIFKEGRVYIDYFTEDSTNHRLIEKTISIDGLPVLTKSKDNQEKNTSVLYDAPLAEGPHTLSVSLRFGEKNWISGSPLYDFRLKFDRKFIVLSGQTTVINLIGMPKDGFRSSQEESRYARASSRIMSTEHEEFFPEQTCKMIKEQEKRAQEKAAAKKTENEEGPPVEQSAIMPAGEGALLHKSIRHGEPRKGAWPSSSKEYAVDWMATSAAPPRHDDLIGG